MDGNAGPSSARGSRGRGRGARGGHGSRSQFTPPSIIAPSPPIPLAAPAALTPPQDDDDDEQAVCFICAEPVVIYAVGPCNHRTCHVCSLRLRALYKKMECTFCKTPLDHVIFTASPDQPFESFGPDATPYTDNKLGVAFETKEQQEDAVALLRFNCPDPKCDEICGGWGDLRRHVKREHSRLMCDLCTRNQKIFAHEHTLFTQLQLQGHIEYGEDASNQPSTSTATPSGFTGHPACDFCRVNYYDADELFKHCRERHEQCFICVRSGGGRMDYYLDYPALERHFAESHYYCTAAECKEKKFIVFETMLDLQAHRIEAHGAEAGDKRANREARRVDVSFTHEGPARGGPSRQPAQPPQAEPAPVNSRTPAPHRPIFVSVGPGGSSVMTPGRQIPGLGPSRPARQAFGSNLTSPENGQASTSRGSRPARPARPPSPKQSTEEVEKHRALLEKVAHAVDGSDSKVTAFKTSVRSYRASEMSANDLLDTFWSIFDRNMRSMESTVEELAGILDLPGKRHDLLSAWKDFSIEHDQFPSLAPIAPTLNQHAHTTYRSPAKPVASSSSSSAVPPPRSVPGMATYAARNGQRNPTVWARVQAAAASGNSFPSLSSAPPAPAPSAIRNKAASSTAWSSSAHAPSPTTSRPTTPRPPTNTGGATFVRPNAEFPDLPASSVLEARAAAKRAVFGARGVPTSAWVPPASVSGGMLPDDGPDVNEDGTPMSRKKKGKQKVLLFSNY